MSRFPNPYSPYNPAWRRAQPMEYGVDRSVVASFMNQVYAWMCVGLATTAVVAWWVSQNPRAMRAIFSGGAFLILVVAQLALVFAISYAVNRIGAGVATVLFLLYSVLMGLTFSAIFVVYQLGTIGLAFATAAGMFAAMSIIGFITRADLGSLGAFLLMALIGLIIASVVSLFWANSTLIWIINYAGVGIFLGLTVYDTQRLKMIAQHSEGNRAMISRLAISGSLILYLDFVNLFLFLLRILGSRRQ